jgi:hypothetical protein
MPIDWNRFDKDLDRIIERGAEKTDEELAEKAASLTRMTADEIRELLPSPADVKKLSELMQIVRSAKERTEKVNDIAANAEKFAGIVLTLLTRLA